MCDVSEEEMDKVNVLKRLHVDGEWAFFFIQGLLRTNVIVSLWQTNEVSRRVRDILVVYSQTSLKELCHEIQSN